MPFEPGNRLLSFIGSKTLPNQGSVPVSHLKLPLSRLSTCALAERAVMALGRSIWPITV
jgi:hypothetical protein